eukprot:scaffold35449_cov31-Tisochrysis_lutea.AAC.2
MRVAGPVVCRIANILHTEVNVGIEDGALQENAFTSRARMRRLWPATFRDLHATAPSAKNVRFGA